MSWVWGVGDEDSRFPIVRVLFRESQGWGCRFQALGTLGR